MSAETTTETSGNQHRDLRTRCAFCLAVIDVNLDKRDRPYWVCVACQTRTFATRTTLESFKQAGWIWSDEPPLEALRSWLDRIMVEAGLKKKKKR